MNKLEAARAATIWIGLLTVLAPQPGVAHPTLKDKMAKNAPVDGLAIYLVGFHPMKIHPELQMESHHYCRQVNVDFAQCVLFDGNTKDANMNGIEYIISEKLFDTLPENEKTYWHPHNGEILSGQLIAPALSPRASKSLMKSKMNSYGKTWHVWNTGSLGHPADKLPLGEPMLAWSFNRFGEALPGLIEQRDRSLRTHTAEIQAERSDLKQIAKPQSGVDALKGRFGRPTQDIEGVVDNATASTPSTPSKSPPPR